VKHREKYQKFHLMFKIYLNDSVIVMKEI